MVAGDQNTFDLNLGHETLVMGWVDVRQGMSDRRGSEVTPVVRPFAKPILQFTANRFNIGRGRGSANERGNDPVFTCRMRMNVRWQVDMENIVTLLPPFLI